MEEVTKLSFTNGWTLIFGWSYDEIARYLETFRMYENKTSELIRERIDSTDVKAQLTAVLTTIRAVNKTDVATLSSHLGVCSSSSGSRARASELALRCVCV